jgi:apolipoprotein N-acyltransferase
MKQKIRFYRIFLMLLSVTVIRLSFVDGPFPILAWVAFVPFGLSLNGTGKAEGFCLGFLMGFPLWLGSVWWLSTGIMGYMGLSWALSWCCTILYCAYASIPYALFGLFNGIFQWTEKPFGSLRSAVCMTVLVLCFPNLFPGNPAHALYPFPVFTQILDLGGVPLLLFCLLSVNWLLVEGILRTRKLQSNWFPFVSVFVLMGLITIYGVFRLNQFHSATMAMGPDRLITIASIQPNIPVSKRADVPPEDKNNDVITLVTMSEQALKDNPNAELVVWPEIPLWRSCDDSSDERKLLLGLAKEKKTPFLINCAKKSTDGKSYSNTAMYISKNGEYLSWYQKQKQFPFGEYIPYERQLPFLRKLFIDSADYVPGHEDTLFEIKKGCRIIPTICYEVVFSSDIRRFVEKGGNIIVNMADDAWFGKGSASAFHMSLGIYRAIEYRVPVIRVTNSGNGLFVRASGEIVPGSRTPDFRKAVKTFPVRIPENRSPYTRIGDAFLYLITILWCLDLGREWVRSRNRRKP